MKNFLLFFAFLLGSSSAHAQYVAPLNGRALSLPKPDLPMGVKLVNAIVTVKVLVNERGSVISARAIRGVNNLSYRRASETAAAKATFAPVLLNGKPVKFSGTLEYVFSQTDPLRIFDRPRPSRPKDYGTLDLQGTIRLRIEFLATGKIGKITLLNSLVPELDELAVEAAKKIRFRPKIIDGKSVDSALTIEYSYSWDGGWRVPKRNVPSQDVHVTFPNYPQPRST